MPPWILSSIDIGRVVGTKENSSVWVAPLIAAAVSVILLAALTIGLQPLTVIAPWSAAIDAIDTAVPGFVARWLGRLAIAASISIAAAACVSIWGSRKGWSTFWRVGGVVHIVALSSLLMIWAAGTFTFALTEVALTEPWRSLGPSPFAFLAPLLYLPRLAVAGPVAFWIAALVRARRRRESAARAAVEASG